MIQYEVKIINSRADWNEIPKLNIDCQYPGNSDSIKAYAQLCCDSEAFYVHMLTTEPETRAVEKGPLGLPSEDSCLEFFLCPVDGDKRYFNIEFNSNSCMYLGIGSCIENLVRLVPEDGTEVFAPKIRRRRNGWEIFYKIPFEFIRRFFPEFEIFDEKIINANFYKCSDLGNYPHYLSWSPIEDEPLDFHRPECFGKMKLIK